MADVEASNSGAGAGAGHESGIRDPLTGLLGPEVWRVLIAAESDRCRRYDRPAAVVLAQIVGLDEVRRELGSDIADVIVVAAGRVLRAESRSSDYVARLVEDRFGILLTETDEVTAINMVERIRERCEEQMQREKAESRVSFGWAGATTSRTLVDAVVLAADRLDREAAG